jgi:hypothetical protein
VSILSRLRRVPARLAPHRRSVFQLDVLERRALLSTAAPEEIVARPAVQAAPLASRSDPAGLTPAQVRGAYGFDKIRFDGGKVVGDGSGQTIAIVDVGNDPNIAADLHQFDQAFGLPDPPSFVRAVQDGAQTDPAWSLETSLDVEWAHAVAPQANILLVEARSASLNDLLGAVDFARQQPGVVAVSMSWGGNEFPTESLLDGIFTTPAGHIGGSGLPGGVTFVAASGDSGAWNGPGYPSASPNVLSVGGTSLSLGGAGQAASESGWSGGGGGFSVFEQEPSYQFGVQTTGLRTTPDVALNADPAAGFAVYDSVALGGQGGWFTVGGTSAAAPQWAGLIAIADQGLALGGKGSLANAQASLYALPGTDFHDIATGSNGYAARPGYDLATGLGSPVAGRLVGDLLAAAGITAHGSSFVVVAVPSFASALPQAVQAPVAQTPVVLIFVSPVANFSVTIVLVPIVPIPFATAPPSTNPVATSPLLLSHNLLISPITPSNLGQEEPTPEPVLPSTPAEEPPISIGFGDAEWITEPMPDVVRPEQPVHDDVREANPAPQPSSAKAHDAVIEDNAIFEKSTPTPPPNSAAPEDEEARMFDLGGPMGLVAVILGGTKVARELESRWRVRRIALRS